MTNMQAVIAIVVAASLALLVVGALVGCKAFPIAKLRGWLGRALGAAGSLAMLAALIFTVYAALTEHLVNECRLSVVDVRYYRYISQIVALHVFYLFFIFKN